MKYLVLFLIVFLSSACCLSSEMTCVFEPEEKYEFSYIDVVKVDFDKGVAKFKGYKTETVGFGEFTAKVVSKEFPEEGPVDVAINLYGYAKWADGNEVEAVFKLFRVRENSEWHLLGVWLTKVGAAKKVFLPSPSVKMVCRKYA